ncbi:uncharacterized protein N7515_006031 [Penicillium bovifimosum]|uniref:Uncharacterized protein n=1 Tax=Penicillium bovifimosum TaxID=126998 RepID=A0A9W9L0T4_9EURO|nr:uncharacterized protein N7515_006031 [Penicillium bovifimosum]KAJ5129992.1 hypothetical protein N7515_006031 [Penicillium bovifimosum]
MFHRRRPATTVTRTTKPTLMTRLKGRNAKSRTVKTTTTTHPTVTASGTRHTGRTGPTGGSRFSTRRHHGATTATHTRRRKPSLGDKLSGAMLRLKGSLTHRPAVKAAGTRRMHGTDGRGSRLHRVY